MREVEGKTYKLIGEAAHALDISLSTLRRYIRQEILPKPKKHFFGSQEVSLFSAGYIQIAKKKIMILRKRKG